eukprot:346227-Rhodomonas_salina.3
MSGTETLYGATSAVRSPVLSSRMVLWCYRRSNRQAAARKGTSALSPYARPTRCPLLTYRMVWYRPTRVVYDIQ